MTIYYVSSSLGSDTNSGLSASSAWASVAQVNTAIASNLVRRGDAVKFRRGDTFYGAIAAPVDITDPTAPHLVLAAYGSGARPIINAYKVLNTSAGWTEHTAGVWKVNLTAASGAYTGNTAATSTAVGFLKIDGIIRPALRTTLAGLSAAWDFYSDATYLYVKATANPTTLAADIRASIRQSVITISSCMTVSGLDVVGGGLNGIDSGTARAKSVRISGNEVREIGGSILYDTTRAGNGIQVWIGSQDFIVTGNDVHDVYDVAFTFQGNDDGASTLWRNCHFRHNRSWNCNQDFEVWSEGTPTGSNGFFECSFEHNTCINAGRSWAADVRPDNAGRGTSLLLYNMQLATNIVVRRNVFFDPRDNMVYCGSNGGTLPAGYDLDDNTVFLRPGKKISAQAAPTIEDPTPWRTLSGKDKNSRFFVIPASVATVDEALAFIASHAGGASATATAEHRALADLRAEFDTYRAERAIEGFGFPASLDTALLRGTDQQVLGQRAVYFRCRDGGVISSIQFEVTVSAGNVSVGVFRNSGSRSASVPGAPIATVGSTACPAVGVATITLGATVTVNPGDWIALASDSATAAFRAGLAGYLTNALGAGREYVKDGQFPLPSVAPTALSASVGPTIVLRGV